MITFSFTPYDVLAFIGGVVLLLAVSNVAEVTIRKIIDSDESWKWK